MADSSFSDFVHAGTFDLVVGTDSITDLPAVADLDGLQKKNSHITVCAHLHERAGVLFHPKLAWFVAGKTMRLIVGSGNLTRGGLTGNWEAFTMQELSGQRALAAERRLGAWKATMAAELLTLDDPRVAARAKKNGAATRRWKKSQQAAKAPAVPPDGSLPALVAEIPRNRPGQADLSAAVYEGFFGVGIGKTRRIVVAHVNHSGSLDDLESRKSVEVASQNYRFELGALRSVLLRLPGEYPLQGRPIAAFVHLPDGGFLYRIVLPGQPEHDELDALLTSEVSARSGSVRRLITDSRALHDACPDCAIWKARVAD